MPRQRGQRQNFTFNKGWNTEASPLTFPENTASDLDNVVLDVDGSIRRRLGVVCESATSTRYLQEIASQWEYIAIGFFKWTNVAGSGNFNLLVSQKGTKFQFNGEDGTDYGTVDFSSRVIAARASDAPNEVVEVASGLGYLFVTGPSIDPFYLSYDVSTDTISLVGFEIQIRDFDGIDDGLDVDERPGSLSTAHEYNLRNQGWPTSFQNINDSATKSTSDPVEYTFTTLGTYPSNADIIYYGKTSSGTDESEIDRFNPATMAKNVFGTSPAPRGKYIFNAFDIDRSSIVSGASSEVVNNRPQAVGFHNGRVFYAGVNAVGYTGKVYYSQQLTNINKVGKCYQEQDPTSEDFNELLATDGGEIDIPNCGNILRLEEGPAGIVVFASNGMWEITGQEGKFSATEFFVRKVTDIGCVGRETVINADGTFYYWSDAGIVGTSRDQVSGNLSADVITQTSIQLGYLLFGGPQRRGGRGVWLRGEKKAVWLYSTDATYDNVSNRFHYNGVLVLDVILGAFYKYSISDFNASAAPYVSGIVESSTTVVQTVQEPVTAGGVTVTAGGADVTVGVDGSDADTITSTWKLQCIRPTTVGTTAAYGIDFATLASRTFTDWYFEDSAGANYDSYLETGFDYGGQAMFDKKPTYVYTYMSRVSKSALDGGYYNIPDPTDTVVEEPDVCCEIITLTADGSTDISSLLSATSRTGMEVGDGNWIAINDTDPVLDQIGFAPLATQWDLSSIVTASADTFSYTHPAAESFSVNGANISHIRVANDGVNLFVTDRYETDKRGVYKYTMSTPYDFSTLAYSGEYLLTNPDSVGVNVGPADCTFNSDGTVMFVVTGVAEGRAISKYNLSSAYTLPNGTPTVAQEIEYYPDLGFTTSTSITSIEIDEDGTTMLLTDADTDIIYEVSMSTAYDLSTATLTGTEFDISGSVSTAYSRFGDECAYLYATGSTGNMFQWTQDCDLCGTLAVDLLPSDSFTTGNGVSYLSSAWNPDGTKFWSSVDSSGIMYETNLSTAWDITTASDGTTYDTGRSHNRQFAFTNSGTRFITYDPGSSTKTMYTCAAYDLSSGFASLGSRTTMGSGFVVNAAAAGGNIFGIISGSEIQLWSHGGDWDDGGNTPVEQSSWDFDAAVSAASLTWGNSQQEDAGFSNDGTKVYVISSSYSYLSGTAYDMAVGTMSTAWDLSTTTLDGLWTVYSAGGGLGEPDGEVRVIEDLDPEFSQFLIGSVNAQSMTLWVPEC